MRTKLQDANSRLFAGICKSARSFCQPAPILDFIWYPMATPLDPASFCIVASVRECPVKLLDASDGRVRFLTIYCPWFDRYNIVQLRASYRIVDHRERQIAPHSLVFNLTAQKLVLREYLYVSFLIIFYPRLYCGFEDAIELFDLSRPGEGTRLHTTPSKKSKDGLKGRLFRLIFLDLTLARRDHLCHCILTLV